MFIHLLGGNTQCSFVTLTLELRLYNWQIKVQRYFKVFCKAKTWTKVVGESVRLGRKQKIMDNLFESIWELKFELAFNCGFDVRIYYLFKYL